MQNRRTVNWMFDIDEIPRFQFKHSDLEGRRLRISSPIKGHAARSSAKEMFPEPEHGDTSGFRLFGRA